MEKQVILMLALPLLCGAILCTNRNSCELCVQSKGCEFGLFKTGYFGSCHDKSKIDHVSNLMMKAKNQNQCNSLHKIVALRIEKENIAEEQPITTHKQITENVFEYKHNKSSTINTKLPQPSVPSKEMKQKFSTTNAENQRPTTDVSNKETVKHTTTTNNGGSRGAPDTPQLPTTQPKSETSSLRIVTPTAAVINSARDELKLSENASHNEEKLVSSGQEGSEKLHKQSVDSKMSITAPANTGSIDASTEKSSIAPGSDVSNKETVKHTTKTNNSSSRGAPDTPQIPTTQPKSETSSLRTVTPKAAVINSARDELKLSENASHNEEKLVSSGQEGSEKLHKQSVDSKMSITAPAYNASIKASTEKSAIVPGRSTSSVQMATSSYLNHKDLTPDTTECPKLISSLDLFDLRTSETTLERYLRTLCSIDRVSSRNISLFDNQANYWFMLNPAKQRAIHCKALHFRRKNCFLYGTMEFNMRAVSKYTTAVYFSLYGQIDDYLACEKNVTKEPPTYLLARLMCRAAVLFDMMDMQIPVYDYGFGLMNGGLYHQTKCNVVFFRRRYCYV